MPCVLPPGKPKPATFAGFRIPTKLVAGIVTQRAQETFVKEYIRKDVMIK